MSNPFANIQPSGTPKPLQVLSISNIDRLSKIMPMKGFLCPDFTRYAIRSGGSDFFNYKIFDTQSDELIMETKKNTLSEISYSQYFQFNRDGSKVLFEKKIYDCNSSKVIGRIHTDLSGIKSIICDMDFRYCYYIKDGFFKSGLFCVNMTNSREEWFLRSPNHGYFEGNFTSISSDGNLIAFYRYDKKDCLIIDTRKHNIACNLNIDRYIQRENFSLDGSSFFTDGYSGSCASIWSMSDGKRVYENPDSFCMTASMDNSVIFSVNKDGNISMYDVKQWKVVKEIRLDYDNYKKEGVSPNELYKSTSLKISSDGKKLLIGYVGGWDIWGVY